MKPEKKAGDSSGGRDVAYEVLARKWRPQQFADVVGQGHATQTLQNAITGNRMAHAYLFAGPRGIGKTSLARIMAKALNCKEGPTTTPCDKCDSCREIMAGSSVDVLEIDGASNTGVDQVRELRDNVMFMPARGPYKIYIIDEVHMLSVPAFNALLKTLEEPPPHVKFIFATTDPQKVLPTVLSRCQRFDLRRIPLPLIVERLKLIAKAEKVDIEEDALMAIARGAEGGLRDAESALDQLISFRGKRIVEADVLAVFGLVARRTLENLAEAVLKGDVPRLIGIVAELDAAGKDMQRIVVELLEHFRNLLVFMHAPETAVELDLLPMQVEALKGQAALTHADRVLRIAELLAQTEDRLKYALSKRILAETALIRCARMATVVSIDEILRRIEDLKQSLEADAAPAGQTSAGKLGTQAVHPDAGGAPAVTAHVARVRESGPEREGNPRSHAAAPSSAAAVDELGKLSAQWHEIIDAIGKVASLARSLLMDSRPLAIGPDKVLIGFDPEFSGNAERIRTPYYMKAIQSVLTKALGRPVNVEFAVIQPDGKVAVPTDHAPGAGKGEATASPKTRKTAREWLKDPSVQKTLDAFKGSIVDIRD